jgi:hypothetical protein
MSRTHNLCGACLSGWSSLWGRGREERDERDWRDGQERREAGLSSLSGLFGLSGLSSKPKKPERPEKRDRRSVTDEQELMAMGQTSRQGAQGRASLSSGSVAPVA